MARLTKRMLELSGQSPSQDWLLALERLKRAGRGRTKLGFRDIRLHERSLPHGVMRIFTGTAVWEQAAGIPAQTSFFASPVNAGYEDLMTEGGFSQLLETYAPGPGVSYEPTKS